jgi:hypothetical protein
MPTCTHDGGVRKPCWWTAAVVVLGAVSGCTGNSEQAAPVPVQGEFHDTRRLAGTWRGEFHSPAAGRVGTIFFDLRSGGDTAYGNVTFNRVVPVSGCTDMARPQTTTSVVVPVVLRFGALATAEGSLGGWLAPYRDPDLSCWMDTWFEGRLLRDTLRGGFFSRRTDTDTVRVGTWWAARAR